MRKKRENPDEKSFLYFYSLVRWPKFAELNRFHTLFSSFFQLDSFLFTFNSYLGDKLNFFFKFIKYRKYNKQSVLGFFFHLTLLEFGNETTFLYATEVLSKHERVSDSLMAYCVLYRIWLWCTAATIRPTMSNTVWLQLSAKCRRMCPC